MKETKSCMNQTILPKIIGGVFFWGVLFGFFTTSYSQIVISFNDASKYDIEIKQLDSVYQSGIHTDTTLAVFKDDVEEYIGAYQNFIKGLGKFLQENDFSWENKTRCFNRIYFNPDGEVDYYIYQFPPNVMKGEKEVEFQKLVKKYIQQTKFGLKSDIPFAQCSPVTYQ